MGMLLRGFILLLLFSGFLLLERRRLARLRARVPLRICVTGTRGKSAVTRQVAAALRASGRAVLAKTTGSKPVLIFPDGREREIDRPGPASVLEQKRVLALAARLGVDALVAEMMSIRPECLAVESGLILRPGLLAVTNVRLDHEEEMGRTREEIAESLAAAIPGGGTVLVPEGEVFPAFARTARRKNARLVSVPQGEEDGPLPLVDFPENVRLSLAVAERAGIDRRTASRGIASAEPDFGDLRAWSMVSPASGRTWHFVSIFAANEPESTRIALERARRRVPFEGRRVIALLNLRADRASRTRRWLEAIRNGFFAGFDRVVFIGEQAPALGRLKFPRSEGIPAAGVLAGRSPAKVTAALWPLWAGEAVVVGAGNIAGLGGALVEYWDAAGTRVPC
ncbi:MAG: poly-gamma-glutamate synthase PgsB [Acidobacteria bacterium]|nr:poly-gamma-glutamate synthase PgsB [Acidobacteriota bacterium]